MSRARTEVAVAAIVWGPGFPPALDHLTGPGSAALMGRRSCQPP